ncbi:MAG: Hsp20/alpha crystallin family protein [Planctomycetes bacterium]|jgi:HSP20 family protein|nr:Hsp20/alpha crystallin family protein [Planctomycetota bacterium]
MPDFDESLWREFLRLSARMDDWVGGMAEHAVLSGPPAFSPRADVCEDGSAYHVRVELPGVDPGEVHVVLEGHALYLWGDRKSPRTEGSRVHQMEIAFGPFYKAIRLPGPVDPDRVSTSCEKGMLVLEIGKPQTRRIRVRLEGT